MLLLEPYLNTLIDDPAVVLPIFVENELLLLIRFCWLKNVSVVKVFFKVNNRPELWDFIFFYFSLYSRVNRFFFDGESVHLPWINKLSFFYKNWALVSAICSTYSTFFVAFIKLFWIASFIVLRLNIFFKYSL